MLCFLCDMPSAASIALGRAFRVQAVRDENPTSTYKTMFVKHSAIADNRVRYRHGTSAAVKKRCSTAVAVPKHNRHREWVGESGGVWAGGGGALRAELPMLPHGGNLRHAHEASISVYGGCNRRRTSRNTFGRQTQ